jgi:glycosyltransferase involved in cell wall biosynthesis
MKIAIIAPSPVPFTIGGTEKLCSGLVNAINQMTPHEAELIKIPSPESDSMQLIKSYRRFFELDLSHFDCILSTKYPSWMVRHPRHFCYMFHRLRGLYDTYFGEPESTLKKITCPSALRILDEIERSSGNHKETAELFSMLDDFSEHYISDPSLLALPGPFIQKIIHYLDNAALAKENISGYFSISSNVAKRQGYFPPGVKPKVIYPPSSLPYFRKGKYEYLLSVSRLDGPKRINLLVEAMRYVKRDIQVLIAGSGPQESYLRELARGDDRIKFIGFVSDIELISLYSNALAVVFAPYDEDYGLVTIEAMKSAKPVITALDSGGPNEFVIDGKTGFSVNPDPRSLAEKISYLAANPDSAALMGEAASALVSEITWDRTAEEIVGEMFPNKKHSNAIKRRQKIVITSTFPVFPPINGGQCRIFYLYGYLARYFDVEIVAVTSAYEPPSHKSIAPGLTETRVPKSKDHEAKESLMAKMAGNIPVTDIAMPELIGLTPAYSDALLKASSKADLIIVSHPYLVTVAKEIGFPRLIYEAQDVEYELKTAILQPNSQVKDLLQLVHKIEQIACSDSQCIICCSELDKLTLAKLYDIDLDKINIIPNGIDMASVVHTRVYDRLAMKERMGLHETTMALFIGSWHGPNIEAVERILDIASHNRLVKFLIAGSVCDALSARKRPPNVGLLGVVDEDIKDILLSTADLALNPICSGSGTNIKMIEYMAAGVPVLSTPHGARGLDVSDGIHAFIRPIDGFVGAIEEMISLPLDQLDELTEKARELVCQKYDWALIAKDYKEILEKAIG